MLKTPRWSRCTYGSSLPLRVQHATKGLLSEEEGVPKERIHGSILVSNLREEKILRKMYK